MISVLLCVRNGEGYIRAAIQSVLDQTYKDFELIIVVNGSTDMTLNIANSYEDPRVRVYQTEIQQLTYNLNFALNVSEGSYIARIDADDVMKSERLGKQFSLLNQNEADVVGSSMEVIDSSGRKTGQIIGFPVTDSLIRKKIWYRWVIAHPELLRRMSVLLRAGG